MAGVLLDIKIILASLKTLHDLGKTIKGNYKRCDLLIQRCSLFEDELTRIDNNNNNRAINAEALRRLREIIDDCAIFLTKYGGRDWKSVCSHISSAKGIESEFNELNRRLTEAGADLFFAVIIGRGSFGDEIDVANRDDFYAIL